jgi:hypothetical protein
MRASSLGALIMMTRWAFRQREQTFACHPITLVRGCDKKGEVTPQESSKRRSALRVRGLAVDEAKTKNRSDGETRVSGFGVAPWSQRRTGASPTDDFVSRSGGANAVMCSENG